MKVPTKIAGINLLTGVLTIAVGGAASGTWSLAQSVQTLASFMVDEKVHDRKVDEILALHDKELTRQGQRIDDHWGHQ